MQTDKSLFVYMYRLVGYKSQSVGQGRSLARNHRRVLQEVECAGSIANYSRYPLCTLCSILSNIGVSVLLEQPWLTWDDRTVSIDV